MGDIPEFTTRPELAGTFGMVASTHWLASAAGMAVLERGGNAFDAAVAAGLVLQVTEPHLNGLGGEVPVIAHHAGREETFVLCGQGTAPAAATLEAFGDLGLDLVPGSGLLAACVPGAFGAWMLLLRQYGTLRLRDVMDYAIGYAARGYPVVPAVSWGIASVAELFRDHWPSSAEVYLPGGTVPAPGSRFANPALAGTYQRVLDEAEAASGDRDEQIEAARRVFYEGFVAEAIAAYVASAEVMDVTGRAHRGLLSYADMSAWRPRLEEPLTYDYHGLTVCKTGLRPAGHGAGQRGLHPHCDRMRQAGLRGPGGLVRRPRLHRRAGQGAPVRRVRRRPASPGRAAGLGRAASRRPRWTAAPAAGRHHQLVPGWRRRRERERGLEPGCRASGSAARPGHRRADPADQWPGQPGRVELPRRGHLSRGRGRPVRQHSVRHAQRWLAAVLAGHPRPRFLPRH
jgi:hypothetical protein